MTTTAVKGFVDGTHRAMPPAQTLARIRPHLAHAGITRVADITGLDTIGLPVAVAIRPASGTLAVEGGKGVSFEAAMTSAAMEAIERFVAEVEELDELRATTGAVADRLPVAPDAFPMFRYARVSPERAYAWAAMRNLFDERESLVPADLVGLPTGEPRAPLSHPWAAGSNGLASGNTAAEALCAALYEVIERDATSCWQVAHRKGGPVLVVDPATIEGPVLRGVLDLLDDAGAEARIVWCPTDIGVPTFVAYVVDRKPNVGVYKGYGAHLDPEVAMIRAVTEAVQSRTIFVAGARDDLLRPTYEAMKRSDVFTPTEFTRGAAPVSVAPLRDDSTDTFDGDVAVLLERLARAGFAHVLARQLDGSAFEVAAARVVVPGLEPYLFQWVAPGDRALRFDPSAFVP